MIHFRRTVTRDTTLGGQDLHEGDKIVMFYESANRDERVFDHPDTFDVVRPVNRLRSVSGPAVHTSASAPTWHDAEITVAFDEIRRRLPDLRTTAEPDYLQSNFINGIKRLPCAW